MQPVFLTLTKVKTLPKPWLKVALISSLAPDHMITSVLKRVDTATNMISQDFLNEKFYPGTRDLGLIDGAVALAPLNGKILTDQELLNELDALQGKVIAMEIEVPATKEEFLAMDYTLNK